MGAVARILLCVSPMHLPGLQDLSCHRHCGPTLGGQPGLPGDRGSQDKLGKSYSSTFPEPTVKQEPSSWEYQVSIHDNTPAKHFQVTQMRVNAVRWKVGKQVAKSEGRQCRKDPNLSWCGIETKAEVVFPSSQKPWRL